jgi:two-component system chemotaxis response regulator CheY
MKVKVEFMNKSVLIADDSLFMRKWTRKILLAHHYKTFFEASNGLEAVQSYSLHKPYFVLMDITMDKLNGIDALKQIMLLDPSARVVMCSALGQQHIIIEALEAGAKDFIIKPHFDRLNEVLTNID